MQGLLGIGAFLNLACVLITETKNRQVTAELQVGNTAERRHQFSQRQGTGVLNRSANAGPVTICGSVWRRKQVFEGTMHVPTLPTFLKMIQQEKDCDFSLNIKVFLIFKSTVSLSGK